MIHAFGALELLLFIQQTQTSQHLANREMRIVGPEHPAVFVLVIAVAHFVAVLFFEGFAVFQGRTPGEDGVAQVDFLNQDVVSGRSELACVGLISVYVLSDLRDDFTSWLED